MNRNQIQEIRAGQNIDVEDVAEREAGQPVTQIGV